VVYKNLLSLTSDEGDFFEKVQSSARCVATCSETDTDFVYISLDALMSKNFCTIDEQLGARVDFDSMMGQTLHDSLYFWAVAVRFVALAIR